MNPGFPLSRERQKNKINEFHDLDIMKNFILLLLKFLARLMIARRKPKVIGITGSVGKTGAKDAIACVLAAKFSVRKSEKSYNNEFGVPLTILGIDSGGKNIFKWAAQLAKAVFNLLRPRYPEVLVLEMGVDKPKDMDYLLRIVRPDIAVFTSVGEVPVHVENFLSRNELLKEKAKLALAVPRSGFVVYDNDSPDWPELFNGKVRAGRISYGLMNDADIKAHRPEIRFANGEAATPIPFGIAFKIEHKGSTVPFRIDGVFSDAGAYLAGAASAVGIIFGMNLIEISSAFLSYVPPSGRMNLLNGIKGSYILDDTYNSSPSSLRLALDTLPALPAKRKIAVLGDMLELGEFSEPAHRDAGRHMAKVCDIVFAVGLRMQFAKDELIARGFKENENVFYFEDSESAVSEVKKIIREGDLILVKGSRAMRMEKVVEEISGSIV